MKIIRVYKLIKLKKKDYFNKDSMELNARMRTQANTKPERDKFKLINSSLFGKNLLKSFKINLG